LSFLAPLWLGLLVAAAVPILIHLLRRRIGHRVEFPAVRYIERAEREHSRSVKLRNLLLMALRVALVIAIALAAARPLASWMGGEHAPSAVAVVMDNSLSTSVVVGGRPLLEALQEAAVAVLRAASPADQLWVITTDGRIRGGSAVELIDVVSQTAPGGGSGNLGEAVELAARTVAASNLGVGTVALVTDNQRTAWPATPVEAGEASVVVWAPGIAPPVNRFVMSVDPAPSRWSPRGEVAARVATHDSVGFRVAVRGIAGGPMRTVARGLAVPGEAIRVPAAPMEKGWLAGSVELEPDELPGDDTRYFAVWVGDPPRVRLSPDAGPFVRAAVDALRSSSRLAHGDGIGMGAADEIARLPAVILAPSDPLRLADANRALSRLDIPWRFGEARRGRVQLAGARVEGAEAEMRYDLVPQAGTATDTLVAAGGRPWAVSGDGYVLVASPLVPEATTFPVRATFVPWLAEVIVERLTGDPAMVVHGEPGSRIAVAGGSLEFPREAGVHEMEAAGRRLIVVANPDPAESELERLPPSDVAGRFATRRVRVASSQPELVSGTFDAAARRPLLEPILLIGALLLVAEGLLSRTAIRRTA
jgi:hypothetical protein